MEQVDRVVVGPGMVGLAGRIVLVREAEEPIGTKTSSRNSEVIHAGIVDSHALMFALLGDLKNAGGTLALNAPLVRARVLKQGIELETDDGTQLLVCSVIDVAGLLGPQLVERFDGLVSKHVPTALYTKGNCFAQSGRVPFRHLIYPVPESAGLGVRLTLDMGGQAKFGPDVQWVDLQEDLVVDTLCGDAFYAEVRKHCLASEDGALSPGYAGIRPKTIGPGEPASEFQIQWPAIHDVTGLGNLFGIEFPGLTSCLAIGEHVVQSL